MENVRDESIDVEKAINFAKSVETSDVRPAQPQKKPYQAKAPGSTRSSKMKVGGVKVKDSNSISSLDHGTFISDGKGVGIVVDNDYSLRKIAENDETLNLMKKIIDPDDPTFSNLQFVNNRIEGVELPIEEYIRKNPFSEEALKLAEVKNAFKGWDLCAQDPLTGAVLAPAGSPQCIAYKEAMNAVRSGKIRLPTVAEYEEQKRQAEEAKKRGELKPIEQPQPQQQVQPPVQQSTPVPKPEEKPVEPQDELDIEDENLDVLSREIKYQEEAQKMNESQRQTLVNAATADPLMSATTTTNAPLASNTTTPKAEEPQKTSEPVPTPMTAVTSMKVDDPLASVQVQPAPAPTSEPIPKPKKQEPVVVNIGAAEVAAASAEQNSVVAPPAADDFSNTVVMEVPAAKAETFMNTLPENIKSKVTTAEKVKINFVGEVTLPNAVNRISTLRQYRKVAPKNTGEGVTSVVMINSGYIAYVSPVGSLEWALISPIQGEDGGVEYPDTGKIAEFAYKHLITTSIGPMSYVEFLENTAFDDLGHYLYTLMRASQPDEQNISLICQKETCGKEYATKYSIAELPDYFRVKQETKEQIDRIVSNKDIVDDAKRVHDDSPVMKKLVFDVESTGSIFVLKLFDIATIIDRMPILESIKEQYGDTIAILIQFTNEVYIKVDNTGDPSKDYSISSEPEVMAAEYLRLTPKETRDIQEPLEAIPRFDPIVYSMKGRHVCSHCGNAIDNPRQDIMDLVFHIALVARYFG